MRVVSKELLFPIQAGMCTKWLQPFKWRTGTSFIKEILQLNTLTFI